MADGEAPEDKALDDLDRLQEVLERTLRHVQVAPMNDIQELRKLLEEKAVQKRLHSMFDAMAEDYERRHPGCDPLEGKISVLLFFTTHPDSLRACCRAAATEEDTQMWKMLLSTPWEG